MKTMGGRFRAAMLMGAAVSVLVFAAGAKAQRFESNHDDSWQSDNSAPHDNPWPYNKVPRSPVLAVVGDIACQPGDGGDMVRLRKKSAPTPQGPPYTSHLSVAIPGGHCESD